VITILCNLHISGSILLFKHSPFRPANAGGAEPSLGGCDSLGGSEPYIHSSGSPRQSVATNPRIPCACGITLSGETGAGGEWRCCQSNRNSSPIVEVVPFLAKFQAISICHSASAAERRILWVTLSIKWRSRLKWLWTLAWTETNFCKLLICRNRSIARSRLRNGKWLFSNRLLAQRPTSCFSASSPPAPNCLPAVHLP